MARLNKVNRFRGTSKTEDGLLTCGSCRDKIQIGDSYLWWANRAPGMRSGHRRVRCMKPECAPTLAERTPGRAGQLMQLQGDLEKSIEAISAPEDVESVRDECASAIRDLGQEFTDGAENMESGFGHETEQSNNLKEIGENLENLADEIEQIEYEEPDDADDEEQVEEALDRVRSELNDKINEAEVSV